MRPLVRNFEWRPDGTGTIDSDIDDPSGDDGDDHHHRTGGFWDILDGGHDRHHDGGGRAIPVATAEVATITMVAPMAGRAAPERQADRALCP